MATDTWLGNTNNWLTPGNWSLNAVPGAGDDVVIGSAGNQPILTGTTVAVNSITVNGSDTLQLTNAGIDVANGVTLSGSGGLGGLGTSELNGTVTVTGGEQILVGSSGSLEITGAVTGNAFLTADNGVLQLDAASAAPTLVFLGAGSGLTLGSTLTLTNSFTDTETVTLTAAGSGLIDNAGIVLNGGSIGGQGKVTGPLSGTGIVGAANGTLELTNALPAGQSFNFSISASSTLLLDQTPMGSYTYTFTGASGALALGDDLGFQGTISGMHVGSNGAITSAIDIKGHAVNIASESGQGTTSGTITLSDGTVLNLTNIASSSWLAKTASDGNGGTDIYLLNATPPSSTTVSTFPQSQFTFAGVGDFNGDGFSDLAWFNPIVTELQLTQDDVTVGGGPIPNNPFIGNWNIVGVGDFNGDGTSDLVWQRADHVVTELQLFTPGSNASSYGGGAIVNNAFTDGTWSVAGVGDFNGDGDSDLVWQQAGTGLTEIQLLKGTNVVGGGAIANNPFDTSWNIVGTGDFNGDGKSDLVWQQQGTGTVELQFLNGNTAIGGGAIVNNPFGAGWNVVGVGDFNGDGKSDLVYQQQGTGIVEIQFLNGLTPVGGGVVNSVLTENPALGFKVVGVGNFNGSGKPGLVLQSSVLGGTEVQLLNGITPAGGGVIAFNP
jgi:hypothetical protein